MAATSNIRNQVPTIVDPKDIQWIHCNSCYKLYQNGNIFYLLSCANVMCRSCAKKAGRAPFCSICKKLVAFKAINEEMEPKYLNLFKKEMNYLPNVEEFQYKQTMNLAKKIAKTEKILEENKLEMKKLIQYNEQYKKLRAARKQKQEMLKKVYTINMQKSFKTPADHDRLSECSSSNVLKSRMSQQSNSPFSITSLINKSMSPSLIKTESAKQFFQNRGSTASGNKVPFRKKFDLSTTSNFNTYFKPPTKSTPI